MTTRNSILEEARKKNHERWPNGQMKWQEYPVVYLNLNPKRREALMRKSA